MPGRLPGSHIREHRDVGQVTVKIEEREAKNEYSLIIVKSSLDIQLINVLFEK